MELPTNRPGTANTVERELVYNFCNLKKNVYSLPPSATHAHYFVENKGLYPMPILNERIIWTPGDETDSIPGGLKWIASIALPISPNHGADGNAIWNYINNIAP
jgi:hypothetical protein